MYLIKTCKNMQNIRIFLKQFLSRLYYPYEKLKRSCITVLLNITLMQFMEPLNGRNH